MIRRDFLRTLAAFGTVAATGGGVAIAAARPPVDEPLKGMAPLPSSREYLRLAPASLDIEMVRGDAFSMRVAFPNREPMRSAYFFGPEHDGTWPIFSRRFHVDHAGHESVLSLEPWQTLRYRPQRLRWVATTAGGMNVLAGHMTILPDALWRAEEDVISIARQLHPLGVSMTRRGLYEVGFRAPLRDGETSMYANRLESLIEHARPARCEVLNGGAGALIYFEPRGLL